MTKIINLYHYVITTYPAGSKLDISVCVFVYIFWIMQSFFFIEKEIGFIFFTSEGRSRKQNGVYEIDSGIEGK